MHIPKPLSLRRQQDASCNRGARMRKLEMSLRTSVLNGGGGIRLSHTQETSMLDIIDSYLNKSDAGTDLQRPLALSSDAPDNALTVSPLRVSKTLVVSRGGTLSPDTIQARAVGRPATLVDMYNTYSALLLLLDTNLTLDSIKMLRRSYRCDPQVHMLGQLAALTQLSQRLGANDATLVITTRLSIWLDLIESNAHRNQLTVGIGVVNPINQLVENDVLKGTMQSGVSSVVVNPAYLRRCSSIPSIIVVHSPSPSVFSVSLASILPIGIIT